MRLQGRVTFARSDARAEQLAPFAKGGLNGLLWVFDQDDRSEHWSDFLALARELGGDPRITPSFSRAEIASAAWCHWIAEWHHGYPQPEHNFAYREVTYDLSTACSECSVGSRQVEPFRMRTEPRWGRRSVLQMFWVYDAWFVTPEAYHTVFEPFGIASREVLRKSGRPLDTVVQLVVDAVVPLVEYRTEGELCRACGAFKWHAALTDYAPQPKVEPAAAMAFSEGWYGAGGLAFRETLVRQDLVAAVREAGLHGAAFHPCRS